MKIRWEDIVVIVVYFVAVIAAGVWSSIRSKRDSVHGYFLASRSMHWLPVGASLFASNIGSGHFIGLAGSGAASGIGIGAFELNALFVMVILGWVFAPIYMASGVFTMPEYLRKRFGGHRIRMYLSMLALMLYVFTKISADLFAGAIFIQQSLGWNLYVSIVVLLVLAAFFTIGGGLTAVIWTDFFQTVLMVIGAFILMGMSFAEVGGYDSLIQKYLQSTPLVGILDRNNHTCGLTPEYSMHLFRAAEPGKSDIPWTGMVFGLTINAVWYWCTDQVIVQRALASKNLTHAKAGCIMCSYLKILPMFLLVFPGMASRVLYPDEVGCATPETCEKVCGSSTGCTNIAYPLLVIRLMPPGLSGLMLAVMMAALMSSLTSIFNSSSTIFTMDIWKTIRKHASAIELLIVGRVFVVLLVAVSILWIPVIEASQGSRLFDYIQSITSFLAPPICAVFVLAVFSGRINEQGAFWGLMGGLVLGMFRFCLEFSFPPPACGVEASWRPDFVIYIVDKVHYLHFAIFLFVAVSVITVSVSFVTTPIHKSYLYRLTFWSKASEKIRFELDELCTEDLEESKGHSLVESENEDIVDLPNWRKALNFICGVETQHAHKRDVVVKVPPEVQAREAVELLREDPFWRRVVNFNAFVAVVVGVFIFAFYA